MDFVNNLYNDTVRTPYFKGELSVRPIRTLKEPNNIRRKYQFSMALVRDIADGFDD